MSSFTELKNMSRDELLKLAENVGLEVESTIAHDELIAALLAAESEVEEETEGGERNKKIGMTDFVTTYLDVYEAGGTAKDLAKALYDNFPGQNRVRGINEMASRIGTALEQYPDLPKLRGIGRGDAAKKKALQDRIAALKAKSAS